MSESVNELIMMVLSAVGLVTQCGHREPGAGTVLTVIYMWNKEGRNCGVDKREMKGRGRKLDTF
jgi:hypothetical protein